MTSTPSDEALPPEEVGQVVRGAPTDGARGDGAVSTPLPDGARDMDLRAMRETVSTTGSNRLLWVSAALALAAHLAPFAWFGEPKQLGDDVLTEAIAVELVDGATLEGRDQDVRSPPSQGAPEHQQAPPSPPAPPGPPQKARPAVPPSPPPSLPAQGEPPEVDEPKPPKASSRDEAPATAAAPSVPPAFPGEAGELPPRDKPEPDPSKAEEPRKPKSDASKPKAEMSPPPVAKRVPEAQPIPPRPPSPPRPPPQPAAEHRAPPPQPPQAKASPSRAPSAPALARSGEVSQFAKEVVAALAKAKPSAPGITGKVTVTVVVAFGGGVRTARVTGSSGREDLDKLALDAAKKAKLPAPPPDVTTDDLFYDVEYDFK